MGRHARAIGRHVARKRGNEVVGPHPCQFSSVYTLCHHQVGGSAEFVMVAIAPCRMLLHSQSGWHQNRSGAGLPWKRIIVASTYSWHYPIILGPCGGEHFKSNERIRRSEIRARPTAPPFPSRWTRTHRSRSVWSGYRPFRGSRRRADCPTSTRLSPRRRRSRSQPVL